MSHLPTWTRAASLRQLDGRFDAVVVGGGVIGAGAALDLSARGLSVALLERGDFAQGTSSRSTKLLHGGIRYLPQFHLGLVSEGLREQKVLARLADFLFHPLEFVLPLFEQYAFADAPAWAARGWRAPLALRAGLTLYDLLGGVGRPGTHHRRVDAAAVSEMMPRLRPEGLRGGFVYSDAQTDDARLVVALLKTAVRRHGTVGINHLTVDAINPLPHGYRVRARDGDDTLTVETKSVLVATGAFTPPVRDGVRSDTRLLRSKGTHVLVPPNRLPLDSRALVLPETDDGRVLFIVPWAGHSMIGTTDTRYDDDPANPRPSDDDVEYLLRHVRQYLDVGEIEPLSVFAGLRALADDGAGDTSRVSREHVVTEPEPGYVQVAGGKLTTYRRIAAEAADQVARALGSDVRSRSAETPLVGNGGDRASLQMLLAGAGFPETAVDPTIDRYGAEAGRLAALVSEDASLATMLGDGRTTLADVVNAVRFESATTLADVALRRTHLAWFTPDHGRKDAHRIAEIMATELGWSRQETESAVADYETQLAAEGL